MKKNLILLHGALGSKAQFRELETLLKNDFNTITFNFEGHGGRATTKKYTIELFAKNTVQILEEHAVEKTAVFGYSMGGYVALHLALKHPEKVSKIVTLGTKFNWTKETAAKEIKMLDPDTIMEKVPQFAVRLAELHHPLSWRSVVENTAQMMYDLGQGNQLTLKDMENIQQPVLIGIGSKDTMVTIEESKRIAEHLPSGTGMVIDGFPHPIEKTDKTILAKIIIRFINKNS
ncbi:MAG: alpha/beta hydrolase [Bacteroidota bacterium]